MRLAGALALLVLVVVGCGGSSAAGGGAPAGAGSPTAHEPGPLGDTWTRAGTTWRREPVAGPLPRYLGGLAYDDARGEYVLFGGQTARGTSDETWTWTGGSWTLKTPAHRPSPRRNVAMSFDPVQKVVVLYGGLVADQAEGSEAGDTWVWDGVDWTRVGPLAGLPGQRQGAVMVTTPHGVMLFGGKIANIQYYSDAWMLDGATWRQLGGSTSRGPQGRANAAAVWDPMGQSLLVYGGVGLNAQGGPGAQGVPLADTWILAEHGWAHVAGSGPPATEFADVFWDGPGARAVLMLGIQCPEPVNDAWAWDPDGGWSHQAPAPIPARWGAALAEDAGGNLLVFGGDDERGC